MKKEVKKAERYEYQPYPDKLVSEILCVTCKYKYDCDPKGNLEYICRAYKALEKEMP